MANDVFASLWILTENSWKILWRWQEVGNKVENFLNDNATTVTTCNEEELTIDYALAKSALEFVFSDSFFAFVEEFLHQSFVSLNGFFDENRAVVLGFFKHIGWDFANFELVVGIIIVSIGLHRDEVDYTVDFLLEANWKMNCKGVLREALADRIKRLVEIATDLVDLVNEADARHAVFVGLTPNSLRLSFDAHLTIEDYDSTIENTKRTLYLCGKVDVSWSIDNVDLVTFPISGNSGGGNRNTTLFFLFHPVGSSAAGVALH